MDGWMDVRTNVILFFVVDYFYTVQPIEMKLKPYHYFDKMKRWLVYGAHRPTNTSCLFKYFSNGFYGKYLENELTILMKFNIVIKDHKKGYIKFLP